MNPILPPARAKEEVEAFARRMDRWERHHGSIEQRLNDDLAHLQKRDGFGIVADFRGGLTAASTKGKRSSVSYNSRATESGWSADCICVNTVGGLCEHTAALSLLLLRELSIWSGVNTRGGSNPSVERYVEIAGRRLLEDHMNDGLLGQIKKIAPHGAMPKPELFLSRLMEFFESITDSDTDETPPWVRLWSSLWPTAPIPASEFVDRIAERSITPLNVWSHVALYAIEAGLTVPGHLLPFADLEYARKSVAQAAAAAEARRQEEAAKQRQAEQTRWNARFLQIEKEMIARPNATLHRARLALGPKKVTWLLSEDGGGSYQAFSPEIIRCMSEGETPDQVADPYGHTAAPLYDGNSMALFALFRRFKGMNRGYASYEPHMMKTIAEALRHPEARHCIGVLASGSVLEADDRTVSVVVRDSGAPEKGVRMEPIFSTGEPVPKGLLQLTGCHATYIDLPGAKWFRGIQPIDDSSLRAETVEIPEHVAATEAFERFLAVADIPAPPGRACRFRKVTLIPELKVFGGNENRALFFRLSALLPDGMPIEVFGHRGWERTTGLPDGTIGMRNEIETAQTHAFGGIDGQRVGAAFGHSDWVVIFRDSGMDPEAISEWLRGFPATTRISLSPEFDGLLSRAVAATREVALTNQQGKVDWFNLEMILKPEECDLTHKEIALLEAAVGGWVKLPKRGWRRMDVVDADNLQATIDAIGLSRQDLRDGERVSLHALQLGDAGLQPYLKDETWGRIQKCIESLHHPTDVEPGKDLKMVLRPYQIDGVMFLAFLSANGLGGILADEMGLGKTAQALAWLLWLARKKRDDQTGPLRVLVVCPKSVVGNWQSETETFAPSLTTGTLNGKKSGEISANITVVNYAQLRTRAEVLGRVEWDAVILDEGQNIKNPTSATAQAAYSLRSNHRLVLTGTPVENRLLDLWSLMHFSLPAALGNKSNFTRLANDADSNVGNRVRQRVRHFMLRRTKGQVAKDLPSRIEEDIICDLAPEQQALYDAHFKQARQLVGGIRSQAAFNANRVNVLAALTKLRMVCCHPGLAGGVTPNHQGAEELSGKFNALIDILEPIISEGEKVLIFSQFLGVLEMIEGHLTENGIQHRCITGATENRAELIKEFQSRDDVSAFLLSLRAGGSGLNLTAANYVVLFDPWWNPAVEAQAIDRAHRIGQRKTVVAYRLIARGTIEEKIRKMQKDKQALASSVVVEEDIANVLDLNAVRELLQLGET